MSHSFDEFNDVYKENAPKSGDGGWLSLGVGITRVRIVSKYEVVKRHWNQALHRSVVCVGKVKGCPYHADGEDNGSLEFTMWVIDRADGKIKIASFNNTTMKAIADLKHNPEYEFSGDFPVYDIIISKRNAGEVIGRDGKSRNKYDYSVTPSRNETPLTPEETALVAKQKPISDIVDRMKAKVMPAKQEESMFEAPLPKHELPEVTLDDAKDNPLFTDAEKEQLKAKELAKAGEATPPASPDNQGIVDDIFQGI